MIKAAIKPLLFRFNIYGGFMLFPINTSSRLVMDLNGIWSFRQDKDNKGFDEKWYEKPLTDCTTMPVPAAFNDLKEGVEFRDFYGWVFYQREITVPKALFESERVILRFDAVAQYAKVYLNDKLICEHKGGFLPFEVEINDFIKQDYNLLTVAVNNFIDNTTLPVGTPPSNGGNMFHGVSSHNLPNFDFFNYAGIIRPVHIYTRPLCSIEDVELTNTVCENEAVISYKVTGTCDDKNPSCKVEVFDEDNNLVCSAEGLTGKLVVKDVKLWQPLNAYLYNVRFTYDKDVYTLPYGIRTVEVKDGKFLINGKAFYFKGYGKHEDTFPNGRGINLAMNTKDISLMKWQGANSFRTSHYPYSEEMMRQCDREGIVVIDETTAVGVNYAFGGGANFNGQKVTTFDKEYGVKTFEHHKDVITDLITRDKNHACVVMWSIANEPDSFGDAAYEYFAPLFDLARKLDPQKRPCTLISVSVGGKPQDDVTSKLSDVICLNRYYGWYNGSPDIDGAMKKLREELDYWQTVGKPLMFTEYGADTVMGFHDTTPVMYTEEYQLEYYKKNNEVFDSYKFIIGEQVWNFADFATSQGMLRVQGNKKGIFTRDRKPKLVAHYFKERWHNIPDFDYK